MAHVVSAAAALCMKKDNQQMAEIDFHSVVCLTILSEILSTYSRENAISIWVMCRGFFPLLT